MINKQPKRVHDKDINIWINDSCRELVKNFKYLGIQFGQKLTFQLYANKVCQKPRNILVVLRKYAKMIWNLPTKNTESYTKIQFTR